MLSQKCKYKPALKNGVRSYFSINNLIIKLLEIIQNKILKGFVNNVFPFSCSWDIQGQIFILRARLFGNTLLEGVCTRLT